MQGLRARFLGVPGAATGFAVIAGPFHAVSRDGACVGGRSDSLGAKGELDGVPGHRSSQWGAAEGPLVGAGDRVAILREHEGRLA